MGNRPPSIVLEILHQARAPGTIYLLTSEDWRQNCSHFETLICKMYPTDLKVVLAVVLSIAASLQQVDENVTPEANNPSSSQPSQNWKSFIWCHFQLPSTQFLISFLTQINHMITIKECKLLSACKKIIWLIISYHNNNMVSESMCWTCVQKAPCWETGVCTGTHNKYSGTAMLREINDQCKQIRVFTH